MKHEVEIKTDTRRWGDTLSDCVFEGYRNRFAPGLRKRFKTRPDGCRDREYVVPNDVSVEFVSRGSYAAYTMPRYKHAAHLDRGVVVPGWKGCLPERFKDEVQILVRTHEYVLSNWDFERACDMTIGKFSNRKDFSAVIAIRLINPFLDYMEAGLVMTYGTEKKKE